LWLPALICNVPAKQLLVAGCVKKVCRIDLIIFELSLIAAGSSYQKYIAALSGSNPGLKRPDPNNAKDPLTDNNALVVLLEAPSEGEFDFEITEFQNPDKLARHFEHVAPSAGAHVRRRIYIMEGLARKYISILGGHFMMNPSFFLRQERTCVWSNDFTPVSDALPHPSLLNPDIGFHLQYCELRQFNKAIENKPYFCKRTRRHVGMTPARHIEDSTTGILRRKVSWWSRTTPNGGWDGTLGIIRQNFQTDREL
jgi:hypothetical protein